MHILSLVLRASPTARGQRKASPHPQAGGSGDSGAGLLAYRVPGLRLPALPRRAWPRAHSGLGEGGSGTAAPSALSSRLGLSFGRPGGRAGPARGGGVRATPTRARLLLRGPRGSCSRGRSGWRCLGPRGRVTLLSLSHGDLNLETPGLRVRAEVAQELARPPLRLQPASHPFLPNVPTRTRRLGHPADSVCSLCDLKL